jgi:hypothetical protein
MSNIHLPIEEGETPVTSDISYHKNGEFNPNFMYGEYLTYCAEDESPDLLKDARKWIDVDISDFVPKQYRSLIEIVDKRNISNTTDHLNRYSTIGWKYTPEVLESPKGNEMADFIESRLTGKYGGMMSYKKNGYRYSIQKTKVDNE